jgi:elongation factor Ts
MEAAIDLMRKSGKAKADKKAGRVAAEGAIVIADRGTEAAILEINCETDFVAKDGQFRAFAAKLAELALDQAPADVEALKALPLPDAEDLSVEQARLELVSKIGENIQLRRFRRVRAAGDRLGRYVHGQRIGVLVDMKGGDERLAKDIAMHIAASRPVCVTEHNVPQAMLDKEREIFSAQAQDSGKPPHIIDKMVQGRLKKYLSEITLLGQPFVKDPDKTVGQMLGDAGAEVLSFIRFEVGEGVEKKAENFAEEVMAQVKGA